MATIDAHRSRIARRFAREVGAAQRLATARRVPSEAVRTTVDARPARARLGRWAHDEHTVHLVLVDHQMVPTAADVAGWVASAQASGARAIRTGALFPDATDAFFAAGFRTVETLTLLTLQFGAATTAPSPTHAGTAAGATRTRRLRRNQLDLAARVDAASFAGSWSNDAAALGEIMDATPKQRSRAVHLDATMIGFAISGLAGRTGYLQRLAVDPSHQRRGIARVLVADAVAWMRRHGTDLAMVNTAADNEAALALYRSFGFEARPRPLVIVERDLP